MTRLGPLAALFSIGLLALSGCGSGTPAAAYPAGTVHIGAGTLVFATPLPARASLTKVAGDFRQARVLWEKSANAHHLVAPVTQYVTGSALSDLEQSITYLQQQGIAPGGVDRLFKTKVVLSGAGATVTTCDDGSKFTEIDVATGKADPRFSAPANQAYVFETWTMTRRSGHWAISSLAVSSLPAAAAKQCQP